MQAQRKDYVRVSKDGKTIYKRGDKILPVPQAAAIRERLIKLLEEAGGDMTHPCIAQFWSGRTEATNDPDPMMAEWALEVHDLMCPVWEELTPRTKQQKPGEDFFSVFGL